jgi:hypothetical protein
MHKLIAVAKNSLRKCITVGKMEVNNRKGEKDGTC